eukprot:364846-Chlamydomonas_euryale.AAC.3
MWRLQLARNGALLGWPSAGDDLMPSTHATPTPPTRFRSTLQRRSHARCARAEPTSRRPTRTA